MFKQGEFITDGHWNYFVCSVCEEDGEQVCKVVRCKDVGYTAYLTIPEHKLGKYSKLDSPPKDYSPFRVGQVLLQKRGSQFPVMINKIIPGQLPDFTEYSLIVLSREGEFRNRISVYQKNLLDDYEVQNLAWVLRHGSPAEACRNFLKAEIEGMEKQLAEYKGWLDQLHYVEVEDEIDRSDQAEE